MHGRAATVAVAARLGDVGRLVGAVAVVLAVGLAVTNWRAADRSADRSGDEFVDTVLDGAPAGRGDPVRVGCVDAAVARPYVLGRRPDVLIVDDTNIVYDGWGTREPGSPR